VPWTTLEQVWLNTSDGQRIGGWINRRGDRPEVVLFLHGIGDTRSFWLPQMHMLGEHHYPSMAISFRAHGDSSGRIEDFGFSSRYDVEAAVDYLHGQFPGRGVVLVGNSLGSAAAIYAARSLDHQVAGYFLESPYRDLATAVWNRTSAVPPPFNWMAFWGMRMWGKMLLPENAQLIQPIDYIGAIPADVPITLVAARHDRWCRLWEVTDLYQKVQSHAQLVVIDSDRHGACSRTDPSRYNAALLHLLKHVEH